MERILIRQAFGRGVVPHQQHARLGFDRGADLYEVGVAAFFGFCLVTLPFTIIFLLLAYSCFSAAPENSSVETFRGCSLSGLLFFFSLYTMVKSQEASERKQSSAVAASDDDVTATAPLCGGGPNCALQKSPIR